MKAKQLFILIGYGLALFSGSCLAAADGPAGPPDPAQVLQKARSSRLGFIEAVGEVERYAPALPESPLIYKYLLILGPLKTIGAKVGVDAYAGDPLANMARAVTQAAAKWIRLDEDTPQVLQIFFQWAQDGVRSTALDGQTDYLNLCDSPAGLLLWSQRAGQVATWIKATHASSYVLESIAELQGVAAHKVLEHESQFSEADFSEVLAQTTSREGLQEVLQFLIEKTNQAPDPASAARYLNWAISLNKNVTALGAAVSYGVRSLPGQVIGEALERLLRAEQPPPADRVDEILAALLPDQINDLVGTLTELYDDHAIPPTTLDFVYGLLSRVRKGLLSHVTEARKVEIEKIFQRAVMTHLEAAGNVEGTYTVNLCPIGMNQGGFNTRITVVNNGLGDYLVDVNIPIEVLGTPGLDFGLLDVAYDPDSHEFQAKQMAVQSSTFPLYGTSGGWLHFKLEPGVDGATVMQGYFGDLHTTYRVKGSLTQSYRALFDRIATEAQVAGAGTLSLGQVAGPYWGRLGGYDATLQVATVSPRLSATLYRPDLPGWDYLDYGYFNPGLRILYLTSLISPETENGKWTQVRLALSPDGTLARGLYIVGGWGATEILTYRKVPLPKL